ncbi:site-specific integrase [Pseudonocardia tropica]|uniref:Site-specific integrase n=1 Tax=Pseudonocardia tropica TaxID=681289 RepID=A0ABV1JXS4_9PSEU
MAQVFDVAGRMPERFRALVLAAAFTGLRWGELVGLRRCDIDLDTGTVYVRRKLAQLSRGGLQAGPTKSAAGVRNVAVADFLGEELRTHIEKFAGAGAEGLVFRGERGAMLRRGNVGRAARWPETVVKAGLPVGFHFHDLRHTGNQLAANSGATTRELMHRMGHGSMRAAIIYQHASTERDRRIADEMGAMVQRERQPRPAADQRDNRASEDGWVCPESVERAARCLINVTILPFWPISSSPGLTRPSPLRTRLVEMIVHGEDVHRPMGIDRNLRSALCFGACRPARRCRSAGPGSPSRGFDQRRPTSISQSVAVPR